MSKKPSPRKGRVVVACAGSGKTSTLVKEALAYTGGNVLITTYTNENIDQIRAYLIAQCGIIPEHITVLSWFSFLLQNGVRPYQSYMTNRRRIQTIDFKYKRPYGSAKKENVDAYYLTKAGNVLSDFASQFVVEANRISEGKVIARLEGVFGKIFLDEMQDISGYDFELIELVCRSKIDFVGYCDPRQGTYSTTQANKNKKFKRGGIADWINLKKEEGLFDVEELVECHRCVQGICDAADAIFPDLPKARSRNEVVTGHDGVFTIFRDEALAYSGTHKPTVLKYFKNTNTEGLAAVNIGPTKGRTFDRVLFFPSATMQKYWVSKDHNDCKELNKFYVALTRARQSVALVLERPVEKKKRGRRAKN